VSREYVAALEKRVDSYEQLIGRLRKASASERNVLLENHEHAFSGGQTNDTFTKNTDGEFDYTGSSRRSTMYMINESPGKIVIFVKLVV
jgi:hypothetical protein